jgi:ElaA protein
MKFIWTQFAAFSLSELYETLAFRQAVLVVEQKSAYQDLDSLDRTAMHLRAMNAEGGLAGYARCHAPTDAAPYASFGRLVISPECRRKGLGRRMVEEILDRLSAHECDVVIGAQLYLQRFYSSFGFVPAGEPYDDVGVWHLQMRLPFAGLKRGL